MKLKHAFLAVAVAAAVFGNALVSPATTLGAAPAFSLPNSNGANVSLDQFKGKYVVLEWWNHECPFVVKHYGAGNMQKLQKQMKEKDVVWLTVLSSAPGKQGYVTAEGANEVMKKQAGSPAHILLDYDGKVGKMYDAKTTPQMILIAPNGEMVYNGAIDSISSNKKEDIEKAENYLLRAYGEHSSGKEVTMKTTRPYGCSVKYGN